MASLKNVCMQQYSQGCFQLMEGPATTQKKKLQPLTALACLHTATALLTRARAYTNPWVREMLDQRHAAMTTTMATLLLAVTLQLAENNVVQLDIAPQCLSPQSLCRAVLQG